MILYKLVDNELIPINTEYFEYNYDTREYDVKERTAEELQEYKPLVVEEYIYPNEYEKSVIAYTETDTEIAQTYSVEQKTSEEIVAINEIFWSDNYSQIIPLGEKYMYGINKEYILELISIAETGELYSQGLKVFSKPDMTQLFDEEYLNQLSETIKDITQLTTILNYLYDEINTTTVPTVI